MRFGGGCVAEVATMEVSLPKLLPVDYTGVLGEEGEDVPPSPTPDPASPGLTSDVFFQRGFLDCAQAALKFFTEVEGMPENSPLVVGLEQHFVRTIQQYTPASVASPSVPSTFTFPPASDVGGGVMRSKHTHSTSLPCTTLVGSHTSLSSHPESVRMAPYTVTSHRSGSVAGRSTRGEMEKHSWGSVVTPSDCLLQSAATHRLTQASSSVPSTKSLESILQNEDLISTDDLRGVLRCLQTVQSPTMPEYNHHHHPSTQYSTSSTCQVSAPSVPTASQVKTRCSSLDDSGISVDLTDGVDGDVCATESISDDVHDFRIAPAASGCAEDVTDCVFTDGESCVGTENCYTSHHQYCETLLSTEPSLTPPSPLSSALPMSPLVTTSSTTSSLVSPSMVSAGVDSSPSSQLSLLSSLSSGSHRLTSQSGEGSATANRIQSLANEILLLLQEEAEAEDEEGQEESGESDDEEGDESYDDDSDEDDSAVEIEP